MELGGCSISYGHYEIVSGQSFNGIKRCYWWILLSIINLHWLWLAGKAQTPAFLEMIRLVAGGYYRIEGIIGPADLAL